MKNVKKSVWLLIALMLTGSAIGIAIWQPWSTGENEGGTGRGMAGSKKPSNLAQALSGQVTGGEASYTIEMAQIRLPLRASGLWEGRAAARADEWYNNGTLTNTLDYRLETGMITQPAGRDNDSLWIEARFTGNNGAKLTMSMLRFRQMSSDAANSMANTYSLVGGNWSYSPQAIGVIWGPGGRNGPRSGHTKITSGPGNVEVDEIIFVALQSVYYPYASQPEYVNIDNYIHTQALRLYNFAEVVGANGVVLASGVRSLQILGEPGLLTLSVTPTNGFVLLSIGGSTNRSATLQSASEVGTNATWSMEATVNSGATLTRASTSGNRIFRLLNQ